MISRVHEEFTLAMYSTSFLPVVLAPCLGSGAVVGCILCCWVDIPGIVKDGCGGGKLWCAGAVVRGGRLG